MPPDATCDAVTGKHEPAPSLGSIAEPLAGLGDEAQIVPASGIVLFRVGDDVLQAHVLSPGRHGRALDVARALADAL